MRMTDAHRCARRPNHFLRDREAPCSISPTRPKRATNLTLNARLLDLAKALDINLSATVDRLLAEEVRRLYRDQWLVRNREAVDEYNARIERDGHFSDRYRNFLRDRDA